MAFKKGLVDQWFSSVCFWFFLVPLLARQLEFSFNLNQIIEADSQIDCRTFVKWSEIEKSVFYGIGFIIFYVVPFVVTIVLYSRIVKSLTQSRRTLEGEQPHQQKLRRIHQQNRVVMKVFLYIVCAFFICWTPLCVYIVLKKPFQRHYFQPAAVKCMQ